MRSKQAGRLAWAAPVITAGSIAAFTVLMPAKDRDGDSALASFPLAAGVAMLRHGRYDIEVWLRCPR